MAQADPQELDGGPAIDVDDRLARIRAATEVLAIVVTDVPHDVGSPEALLGAKVGRMATAVQVVNDHSEGLSLRAEDEIARPSLVPVLTEERSLLAVSNVGLLMSVADQVAHSLSSRVSASELISAGWDGLTDAAARFDETMGFEFSTFAVPRIRGAILDYLREIDWVPRAVRNQSRAVDETEQRLAHQRGRTPTNREIAEELEVPTTTVEKFRGDGLRASQVSINVSVGPDSDTLTLADTLYDSKATDAMGRVEERELQDTIRSIIQDLPERSKEVIHLYYYEGLTLEEIGGALGFTESRACQIKVRAEQQIRTRLVSAYREDDRNGNS